MSDASLPGARGARRGVAAGCRFRVVDPEGGQVGDLFAFCADDVSEYQSPSTPGCG